jgi:alkaline phosphatase D
MSLSRRTFLLGATTALAACASKTKSAAPTTTAATSPTIPPPTTGSPTTTVAPTTTLPATTTTAKPAGESPFKLGVASGDPLPDRVILWTRLSVPTTTAPVAVTWEIATDNTFTNGRKIGEAAAQNETGFSVHIDADSLKADTRYFYRFRANGFTSAVGTTRTLPAEGATVDKLRFGFGSCQEYSEGYYNAHKDIAASNLDLFVWLGDYIYEYQVPAGQGVRAVPGDKLRTLDDYRGRYTHYRSEPNLQSAHASCPWLAIWDDHEVENNYATNASETGISPEQFAKQRAMAYQAWWEFMPTRLAAPTGPDYKIYFDLSYGNLARFFLLDGRQYRTDQACGDAILQLKPPCDEINAPGRTMLGAEQEAWLLDGMGKATTTWNVVANQVVMADATLNGAVLNFDQWDGYPEARTRLLKGIDATGKTNTIIVTGDIHLAAVADIVLKNGDARKVVATEFIGTSISSGALLPEGIESAISSFPDLRYLNARKRGWCLNEVTPTKWTATYRIVDDATKPESTVSTDAIFTVTPDKPGAVKS